MALEADPILGPAYLGVEDFRTRAIVFGAGMCLAQYPPGGEGDKLLLALLAAASRAVDTVCGRDFLVDGTYTENHPWDFRTRRTKVNNPPVTTLLSYRIRVGPNPSQGPFATFPVESVYINNQENYLELASLAAAGSLAPQLMTIGITSPQVEISYKSYEAVPGDVQAATGYMAAYLMNRNFVDGLIPAGLETVDIGGLRTANRNRRGGRVSEDAPPIVRDLLGDYIRIPIA